MSVRVWICGKCSQPCVLVFWPNRNVRGTHCCLSLYAKTVRRDEPVQVQLG